MVRGLNSILLVSLVLFSCISGCFGNEEIEKSIKLETNVGLGFQKTWENTVENLTKSFFVINNISKESISKTITRYPTNTPQLYTF